MSESPIPNPIPVPEALKRIPVSRDLFYSKIRKGDLPSYRFGRRILVDLNEVLAAMRVGGNK